MTDHQQPGQHELPFGKGRPNTGFLAAKIGTEFRLPASFDSEFTPDLGRNQFATANFLGTQIELKLSSGKTIAATLENSREMREVRSRCQQFETGPFPLAWVSRAGTVEAGVAMTNVSFVVPSSHLVVEGDLEIQVSEDCLRSVGWKGDELEAERLRQHIIDHMVLKTGGGFLLLQSLPSFFGDELILEANHVEFFSSDGSLIHCVVRSSATGDSLNIIRVTLRNDPQGKERSAEETRKKHRGWNASRVRLVALANPPRLASSSPGPSKLGTDLEKLPLSRSPILRHWLRYKQISKELQDEATVARGKHPLLFEGGSPDQENPTDHHVRILNWSQAVDSWLLAHERSARSWQGEIQILVASDERQLAAEEASVAHLIKVAEDGKGVLRWSSRASKPVNSGVIVPSPPRDATSRRQRQAIERVSKGNVALTEVLDILNDPSLATPPKRVSSKRFQDLDRYQRDAANRALGNRSIIAIQGPPGTGKTRLIVAVIREAYRRTEARGGEFRVLITSAQNFAVDNAVAKLSETGGIIIDRPRSREAQQLAEEQGLATDYVAQSRETIRSLEHRITQDPELSYHSEQASRVSDLLRELSETRQAGKDLATLLELWLEDQSLPDNLREIITNYLAKIPKAQDSPTRTEHKSSEPAGAGAALAGVLQSLRGQLGDASFRDLLRDSEGQFDLADYSDTYERINELLRELRRANRHCDGATAPSLLDEITGVLDDAITRLEESGDTPEEKSPLQLQVSETPMAEQLHSELLSYESLLGQHKGAVLARWKRSLEEQPTLWKGLIREYSELRGATCQMSAPLAHDPLLALADSYDIVIIDEAARPDLGDLMIPLSLGKSIVLVGDHNQLPPYVDDLVASRLQEEDPGALQYLGERSLFQELFDQFPTENRCMLERQYRCHPDIGSAVSRAFYGSSLKSGPELEGSEAYEQWLAEKIPTWNLYDNTPLVWIDTDEVDDRPTRSCSSRQSSIAIELAESVISAEAEAPKECPIGLIAFYKDQVKDIQAKLESSRPDYRRWIEIGTVDSFQGKEFPFVVLLTSRTDPAEGRVGFLAMPNRINVAVSRAQKQLVIIGSRRTLLHSNHDRGSQPMKDFVYATQNKLLFTAP